MQPYQFQTATNQLENKSAFLCVTRNNHLRLVAQQQTTPWTETSLELGELTSSNDIVTHATFGDIQGQLLLATYDASKCLRLYRVNIVWNAVQGDYQHGQPPSVTPQLRATHIQLLDRILPQRPNGSELSQILIQPPMVGADKGHVLLAALFTCLPDDQQVAHQANGRGSILSRWELKQSEVVLHDVFKTLKPGTDKLPASKVSRIVCNTCTASSNSLSLEKLFTGSPTSLLERSTSPSTITSTITRSPAPPVMARSIFAHVKLWIS